MSYKKIKRINIRHNLKVSKLQRQYAAGQFIINLDAGKTIINIDESIIDQTDFRRKGWAAIGKDVYTANSQRLEKVSIIGGASSKGDFYYTINVGMNNSERFWYFLLKLCIHLNTKDQNWRLKTLIVLDNAAYHRSRQMMDNYRRLKIPIMFLGPYQFSLAPMELMFSYIKQFDINYLQTAVQNK